MGYGLCAVYDGMVRLLSLGYLSSNAQLAYRRRTNVTNACRPEDNP